MLRRAVAGLSLVIFPTLAFAQGNSQAVYQRAQMLVNDGDAVAGRQLVDSMIAAAIPGTNEYAEGIYWRAVLAPTAAEAEMDYRRVIVEHPLSPRVEDVLLRLAQLELARANYDAALQHLNRLALEYPAGRSRPRASYWIARVLFEKNDGPRACTANADALALAREDDAELRNQILYLNQRCAGVVAVPLSSPATVAQSTPAATAPRPTMPPPATPRDAQPSQIEPPAPETTPTVAPSAPASRPRAGSGSGEWTVQVAAYTRKAEADGMVNRLRQRGYEARVSGTSNPFRVRIGRYETQSQANAVLRSLKAKQIDGFVVQAEPR